MVFATTDLVPRGITSNYLTSGYVQTRLFAPMPTETQISCTGVLAMTQTLKMHNNEIRDVTNLWANNLYATAGDTIHVYETLDLKDNMLDNVSQINAGTVSTSVLQVEIDDVRPVKLLTFEGYDGIDFSDIAVQGTSGFSDPQFPVVDGKYVVDKAFDMSQNDLVDVRDIVA